VARVRGVLIGLAALLCSSAPAYGLYDQAQGGVASPSAVTSGGQTDYSVSLTGRPAIVDVVLVLDNSGSMADSFGSSGSKWSNLASASDGFVDALNSSGLFTRGGRVGVVLFSASATATAPTTDVPAIKQAIADGMPQTSSCISCGIQRATDLLTAIPGAASHRQIVYVVADSGTDSGTTPTLADTVAASNAAHIERRVVGLGSAAMGSGLESIDSNGVVPYANDEPDIGQDYATDPTAYPGATNLSWTFHVAPGFMASSPTASQGSASVSGQDVMWTMPSLGAETATLTFHATHDPTSGCGATSLLSGTAFSDAEGDPAPAAGLGALTLSGCSTSQPPPAGTPAPTVTNVRLSRKRFRLAKPGTVLRYTVDRAARVTVSFDRVLAGRRSGSRCVARTHANRRRTPCTRYVRAGKITRDVTAGAHQLPFAGRLDAGRRLRAGAYRLTLVATAGGRASAPKTLRFTALKAT
jgi:hypothetical protein